MYRQAHINNAPAIILLDRIIVPVYYHLRLIFQLLEIHMATLNMFHLIVYFRMDNQCHRITEIFIKYWESVKCKIIDTKTQRLYRNIDETYK